ncbi:DUF6461 domain-containing protein [Nonomuraea sp. NPDC004580]|uniref:ankyrin repeat domain-containing protein n=1 Tax=Nonomuraea sp. NPDC004580 TaxID=3154552 RepID=UPI0033BDDF7A
MAPIGASDWSGITYDSWTNLHAIRARLDAGADPDAGVFPFGCPLHEAAEHGSPEVVAELARRVTDVDALHEGRTALWTAVFHHRPDNARALVAAGADPWRPMMNGWSPGRLSLATPTPDLFAPRDGEAGLTDAEQAAVAASRQLIDTVECFDDDGYSVACVAGVTAAEAARRLGAVPADDVDIEEVMEDMWSEEYDGLIGITDVPGGCVVVQPWGYRAADPHVLRPLSAGTVCYSLFANPKSGNQGIVIRDGETVGWDTHPGGGSVSQDDSAEEILRACLYQGAAVAYCYAGAGLLPSDARSLTEEAGTWVTLPDEE